MKERIKNLTKRPWALPALCYALCLVIWLIGSLWGLASDLTGRASGRLAPFELAPSDFELVAMEQQPAGLYTLTDDPQMIWQNPDGRILRSLRFTADYEDSAREMCLYYTSAPGEDFSQEKRVFAAQSSDGKSYLYTLPQGKIAALRLDPCSAKKNLIDVHGISLNEDVPLWHYFAPGWHRAFNMILYPALTAAGIAALVQLVTAVRGKKNSKLQN